VENQNSEIVKEEKEEFDFEQEVINIQFALMLKFRLNYEKRLMIEENRVRKLLLEKYQDANYANKVFKRLYMRAYQTIPGEFWYFAQKRMNLSTNT
jgi:hypothetical protein